MNRIATILLCLMLIMGVSVSQQTPSQIVSSGSAFYALNSQDLEVAKLTLLSQIVYGAVVSPSSITSNGAAFYGLDYQGHQVAQTYLLSLIQSGGGFGGTNFIPLTNGIGTNTGFVLTENTTNRLIGLGQYRWLNAAGSPLYTFAPSVLDISTNVIFPRAYILADGSAAFANEGIGISAAGVISGDGSGLTNINSSPWPSDVNATQHDLTNLHSLVITNAAAGGAPYVTISNGAVVASGSLSLAALGNAYVGGSLTIIGDIGTVQNMAVNGTATFTFGFNAAGTSNFFAGVNYSQKSVLATNGFGSFSTLAAATIDATGWTNIWATNNATVYVTATAVAFTIKNRSQNTIYTSPVLTATVPVHLQPGWSVNAASGLAGTALPE